MVSALEGGGVLSHSKKKAKKTFIKVWLISVSVEVRR